MRTADRNDLLFSAEVAEWLRITPRHLRRLVKAGKVPGPLLIGSRLRFDRLAIESFLASQQTRS